MESSVKGKIRGGRCNSNNNKLTRKNLVQSGSGIICNRISASTSVRQHLSESSRSSSSSGRESNPKTSGLECFRKSLTSKEISARAAELIAGARRPGTPFNYE